MFTYYAKVIIKYLTEEYDFSSTPLTATILAGATTTTVRVPVMSDNIVEGDEIFSMSLNVSSSLGPGTVAGSVTNAIGIILDSTSKLKHLQRHYLHNCNHRYNSEVYKRPIHWFRRYRICISNTGTSWRNIQ